MRYMPSNCSILSYICPPLIQSFHYIYQLFYAKYWANFNLSHPLRVALLLSLHRQEDWVLKVTDLGQGQMLLYVRAKIQRSTLHTLTQGYSPPGSTKEGLAGNRGQELWCDLIRHCVPWALGWEKFGWVWHWISANLCNQVSPKFPISCSAQDTSAETDVESRAA